MIRAESPGGTGIGGHAPLDALGLADIEHMALRIDHAIDAGASGSLFCRRLDDITSGRQTALGRCLLSLLFQQQGLLVLLHLVGRKVRIAGHVLVFRPLFRYAKHIRCLPDEMLPAIHSDDLSCDASGACQIEHGAGNILSRTAGAQQGRRLLDGEFLRLLVDILHRRARRNTIDADIGSQGLRHGPCRCGKPGLGQRVGEEARRQLVDALVKDIDDR